VTAPRSGSWRTLTELTIPSEPGNERQAAEEVAIPTTVREPEGGWKPRLHNILVKLHVGDRAQAVIRARDAGI
jgi:hypothetical protein